MPFSHLASTITDHLEQLVASEVASGEVDADLVAPAIAAAIESYACSAHTLREPRYAVVCLKLDDPSVLRFVLAPVSTLAHKAREDWFAEELKRGDDGEWTHLASMPSPVRLAAAAA